MAQTRSSEENPQPQKLDMERDVMVQEIFHELEEDIKKLQSIVNIIKTDLILKNDERAKMRLETSSFLADKINANLIRLYSMVPR